MSSRRAQRRDAPPPGGPTRHDEQASGQGEEASTPRQAIEDGSPAPARLQCQLTGCTEPPAATVPVSAPTVDGAVEVKLLVCKDHAKQIETGWIIGVSFKPEYRTLNGSRA